jgi:propionyl-CoA carboxylase alpha chain
MPGTVTRVAVTTGDTVRAGEPILWLEAMKMQHQINAPADGTVTELPVQQGQQVDVGAVLAVVDPADVDAADVDPADQDPASHGQEPV